jgi:hypothetical protein
MGLVFTGVELQQIRTLAEPRETPEFAANLRRSHSGYWWQLGPSFRAERRWCALCRRNPHAGHQCSRCMDSRVDLGIQRTAAHSAERPTKAALECVLSDTLKGIKAIILRWEWSSRCLIQCSGMWPFRQRTGWPVTQMRNPG